MYRRPKFLEILLEIRRDMAHEVDYDTDLFAEVIRSGRHTDGRKYSLVLDDEKPARSAKSRPGKRSTKAS